MDPLIGPPLADRDLCSGFHAWKEAEFFGPLRSQFEFPQKSKLLFAPVLFSAIPLFHLSHYVRGDWLHVTHPRTPLSQPPPPIRRWGIVTTRLAPDARGWRGCFRFPVEIISSIRLHTPRSGVQPSSDLEASLQILSQSRELHIDFHEVTEAQPGRGGEGGSPALAGPKGWALSPRFFFKNIPVSGRG